MIDNIKEALSILRSGKDNYSQALELKELALRMRREIINEIGIVEYIKLEERNRLKGK
ncbi:MAG: hypothetical protein AABY32_01025 [Nanoarchaeota archaeon]